ncbi:MAG: glycosyltransferase family 39 protein, partial [Anaerolineae bacterium]
MSDRGECAPLSAARRFAAVVLVLSGLAALLTALPVARPLRYGAAVLLLWLLPALAWAHALPGGLGQRLSGGLGLAFVGSGLATLVLHLVDGPFPMGVARLVYLSLAIVPLILGRPRQVLRLPALSKAMWGALALLALVMLLLRTANLGYSEFQGDEAVIMARAAQALAGDDRELFLHQKGPVEILVPMSLWSLTGTVSEWQARLPFALTGMLAVAVVSLLASRWFNRWAGLLAGFLAAAAGFLVAFSRIVQYQNFVVAMGGLGLVWLLSYRTSRRRLDLVLSAIYIAYGLLAHYDTVLIGPAALWILVTALARRRVRSPSGLSGRAGIVRGLMSSGLSDVLIAMAAGVGILALFYLPFVLDPMFSRTFAYLSEGRMGSGLLHNSLLSVWRMS